MAKIDKEKTTEELLTDMISENEGENDENSRIELGIDDPIDNGLNGNEIEDIRSKKSNKTKYIVLAIIVVVCSGVMYYLFGGDAPQPTQRVNHQTQPIEIQTPIVQQEEQPQITKNVPELINNGEVLKDFNYNQSANTEQGFDELNLNSYDQHNSQITTPSDVVIPTTTPNVEPVITEQHNEPTITPTEQTIKPVETIAPVIVSNTAQDEILSIVKENHELLLKINEKLDKLDKLDNIDKLDSNDQEIKQLLNDAINEIKNKECAVNSTKKVVSAPQKVTTNNNYVKDASNVKKQSAKINKKVVAKKSESTSSKYTLKSIMVGRVWIGLPNGVIESFGIGDYLPNGDRIGNIDPDNGVFDTTGKLIIK